LILLRPTRVHVSASMPRRGGPPEESPAPRPCSARNGGDVDRTWRTAGRCEPPSSRRIVATAPPRHKANPPSSPPSPRPAGNPGRRPRDLPPPGAPGGVGRRGLGPPDAALTEVFPWSARTDLLTDGRTASPLP